MTFETTFYSQNSKSTLCVTIQIFLTLCAKALAVAAEPVRNCLEVAETVHERLGQARREEETRSHARRETPEQVRVAATFGLLSWDLCLFVSLYLFVSFTDSEKCG